MAGVTEFNDSKESLISKIRKRDGRIVSFEQSKISNAIYKALVVTGKPDYPLAEKLAAAPEVRSDAVARAKALIADPNYPNAATVEKIAQRLAENSARLQGEGN